MKNFSDLPDTEPTISVIIQLSVITDNGYPGASVRVNQDVIEYLQLTESVEHQFEVALREPLQIEIGLIDKRYDQRRETAIKIDSVRIDGFELVPAWNHLAVYDTERGLQGPTSYLGINGSWKLDIDRPFYQWRHGITGQGWLLEPIVYQDS
jgi:hypothetical protein